MRPRKVRERAQQSAPVSPSPKGAGDVRWIGRKRTVLLAGRLVAAFVAAKDDPRVIQLAALAGAMLFRIVIIHQSITVVQALVAVGIALMLDSVLTYVRTKELIPPLSSLITGAIVALILQSSEVWPYALAAGIAIASKHLIRTSERHIFNPAAFGLAAVLLAFPHLVHAGAEQWRTSAVDSPLAGVGGALAAKKAKQLNTINWFIPVYAIILILSIVAPYGLHHIVTSPKPTFSAAQDALFAARYSFIIFAFYLLTEPRTAPRSRAGQRVYAAFIGVAGNILHWVGLGRMAALFVALLAANALVPLVIDKRFPKKEGETAERDLPGPVKFVALFARMLRPKDSARQPVTAQGPSVQMPAAAALHSADSVAQTIRLPGTTGVLEPPFLTLEDGGSLRIALAAAETKVGRAPDNAVRLDFVGVSRHHAAFRIESGRVLLVDLGSLNGTFVNGRKVAGAVEVHDGDRIAFGGHDTGVSASFHRPSSVGDLTSWNTPQG